MVEGGREMRLPCLRLAMTRKKGCNAPVFVIARHSLSVIARSISDEAISKLNPKLKTLNPKQVLISIVDHKNFACFFRNVKSPLVPLNPPQSPFLKGDLGGFGISSSGRPTR